MGSLKAAYKQQIGRMRERITIKQASEDQNSDGSLTTTWITFASDVPASKKEMTGGEAVKAESLEFTGKATFMIRWRASINTKMIIENRGNTYDIEDIAEDAARRFQTLVCKLRK